MTIYIIIAFVILSINIYLHRKRTIIINKLHSFYDELETSVIKNNLKPDNKLVTFLKINKAPIFNNHLLDFSFIFTAFREVENEESYEKHKLGYEKYVKTLPKDVQNISRKINQLQNSIINLSLLKPINFFVFIMMLFPIILGSYILYKVLKPIVILTRLIKLPIAVKEVYANENVIVSYPELKLYV